MPVWINPAEEVYFITVNCLQRGRNVLCREKTAEAVLDSVQIRNGRREWYCHLCLLMPDHLHALISFTNRTKRLSQVIGDWKRWLACREGIEWQPSYFEHRLRDDREHIAKAQYILQNPVRKGLVQRWEDWEYRWQPKGDAAR